MAGTVAEQGESCVQLHSAYVYDRGGRNRLFQLVRPTEVRWGRVRDDPSEARVVLRGESCRENSHWLSQIEPKRHELVIFRGTERVWEGPIWRVGWQSDQVEIAAHDVFEYLNARPLSKVWDNTYRTNGNTGVTEDRTTTVIRRIQDIVTYELSNPFSYKGSVQTGINAQVFSRFDGTGGTTGKSQFRLRLAYERSQLDTPGRRSRWLVSLEVWNDGEVDYIYSTARPSFTVRFNGSTLASGAVPAGTFDFRDGVEKHQIGVWDAGWVAHGSDEESHFDVSAAVNSVEVFGKAPDLALSQPDNGKPVYTEVERVIPAWEKIDPPINVVPHLVFHHNPGDAKTATKTEAFQMSVGEHVDNLAQRSGADYTVVGRAIHFWDVHRSLGQGKRLTEADFMGDVIVTAYGADHTEVAFVVSESGGYGGAGDGSSYYGPWTKMFTVYDEDESNPPTQGDLNSQASRNLVGRSPVPVEVRVPDNSTIRLSESLSIHDLVPGVRFELSATLNSRKMMQMQKLNQMTVTETPTGEEITVTFVPADQNDDTTEVPE